MSDPLIGHSALPTATDELLGIMAERDQALATLRRLHAAAKIVTAYEWPQDASPMGAMDEFDAAMAEAETILNPSKKGESSQDQQ